MPEIGLPELLIILAIVLILFGPERLAGVGTALGQTLRDFRRGLEGQSPETSEAQEGSQTDSS